MNVPQSPQVGDPDPDRTELVGQQGPPSGRPSAPARPPASNVPPPPRRPDAPRPQSPPGYGGAAPQPPAGGYGAGGYPGSPPAPPQPGYQPGPAQSPGYGQPPGFGHGYGQPNAGPSTQQIATWVTFGGVALLGLIGAILTLTLSIDVVTAASRVSDSCNQFSGDMGQICKDAIKNSGVGVPAGFVIYLILIAIGGAAAVAGAVMMARKKYVGQYLIVGGGAAMFLFTIISNMQYGSTGRLTYDLIAGLLIGIAGGALFFPQVRMFLGLPPMPPRGGGPGPFGGHGHQPPYGQPPYGQPPSGPNAPPGPQGYPPRQW